MGRTDRSSLLIAAPAEQIYRSLVDPDALVRWLPPTGMTGRFDRFDARAGGGYRMVLSYGADPDGGKTGDGTDVVEARFVELVAPERVVQAVEFESDDPSYGGTMTMTWALRPTIGGTLVEFSADDVPAGIDADDHTRAMASSLVNLANLLGAPTG